MSLVEDLSPALWGGGFGERIRLYSAMDSRTQVLFFLTTFSVFSLNLQTAKSDGAVQFPAFLFSWLDDKETFVAGDTATITVRVVGNYERDKYEFGFEPNITVNYKMGNSSYVTAVSLHLDGGIESSRITFSPIMVGFFDLLITDDHFRVFDHTLHFRVEPGQMYPAAGILSWRDGIDEVTAGTIAEVLILPKDAFGNDVPPDREGSRHYNYSLSASTSTGAPASLLDVKFKGWTQQDYLCIEFVPVIAGSLLLHVEIDNQTLHDSPLPFFVNPGELDVRNCVAPLKVETKWIQFLSKMEGLIQQRDRYGNLVSGSYEFELNVVEKGTGLSMPLADLLFRDVGFGTRLFSFTAYEAGNFSLVISDKEKKTHISNTPYDYTVYIGYCDGVKSIVNGSGLTESVAGETATFSVYLRDAYLYPCLVHLESLQVHIMHVSDSRIIQPSIREKEAANGNFDSGSSNDGDVDPTNNVAENSYHKASDFEVTYKPEKSGLYEIRVFCGNIELNGGRVFEKEVISDAGGVNVSNSGVVKYAPKMAKMAENEIIVRLMDSYSNPVVLEQSNLKLVIGSINRSSFVTWDFSDNRDGSYTGKYLVNDIGTYEMCASYKGLHFMPCPFGVVAYENDYFPKASNDTVSMWDDESIDFNSLENDYFAGGNVAIVEYSKPWHGSLLLYGNLFRYTPYKGFYGTDNFSYTLSDVHGNVASALVDLSILCKPPHFASIPSSLQAVEDDVSPTFGGFAGFKITYSDWLESITVTLSSRSGTVLLSPMQMQFWRPRWDQLSARKEAGVADQLKLVGFVDVVNSAFQSIQYSGNPDFYGADVIRVSTGNTNGRNDIDVPIFVQPVNDPPVINTPSFVILDNLSDGVSIFSQHEDMYNFIDDPDLRNFPGNRSRFLIELSMEVSRGLIMTSLPAELIGSTEVKLKTSHQWQPMLTFVTISRHFMVKAKGIRFRGAIDECNSILKQLSYHEGEHGAVLTLTVNDLGNHGCYPDCEEMMSTPLVSETTVNLVRFEPMSPSTAHFLGSAIVVESIIVISLALVVLFFVCKCATVLVWGKKRRRKLEEMEMPKVEQNVSFSFFFL